MDIDARFKSIWEMKITSNEFLLTPVYRQWTIVWTNGTDVFAMDMLSSISQAGGDKSMKPIAFYLVFI